MEMGMMHTSQKRTISQYSLHKQNSTTWLNLSKESAQLMGPRLKEKHLLASRTTLTGIVNIRENLDILFYLPGYIIDLLRFIKSMGIEYDASEWRRFIDSSSKSLKPLFIFNGNIFSSIPCKQYWTSPGGNTPKAPTIRPTASHHENYRI